MRLCVIELPSGRRKNATHSCGFSIKPSEIWLLWMHGDQYNFFLYSQWSSIPFTDVFTCSCSTTTHDNLFSYNCISSQHLELVRWTSVRASMWKAQILEQQCQHSERMQNRQSTGRREGGQRPRPAEEMSRRRPGRSALWRTDPHRDLCHVPLRSKQNKETGRGERERGRKRKLAREKEEEVEERMQNWEWNSREWFLPFPPG